MAALADSRARQIQAVGNDVPLDALDVMVPDDFTRLRLQGAHGRLDRLHDAAEFADIVVKKRQPCLQLRPCLCLTREAPMVRIDMCLRFDGLSSLAREKPKQTVSSTPRLLTSFWDMELRVSEEVAAFLAACPT